VRVLERGRAFGADGDLAEDIARARLGAARALARAAGAEEVAAEAGRLLAELEGGGR
jgi:hypothetical protein